MVLEKLSNSLRKAFEKISGAMFVDKKLVNELIKDTQKALIHADVNIEQVLKLSENIKKRMFHDKIPAAVNKKDYLIRVVYEELINLMGGEEKKIQITKKPTKIMLVGLFGSGKTTTAAKLANYYFKRGFKTALVQTDTYRPAAYEQLLQLATKINVDFFGDKKEKNPVKIYNRIKPKLSKYDVVIIDTAGRDALSDELIKEIEALNKAIEPEEKLLVISADIGQTAFKQAEQFHKSVGITGVIVTKMEGTARGGGALTACIATNNPIVFIGIGEKINDLERFRPKNFIGRLLGMGDLEALLEKTKEVISEEKAEDLKKKVLKGEFNLIDLYEQMRSLKQMGPLSKVMELIPGFSKIKMPKEVLQNQEVALEKWRYIMDSMRKYELEDPSKISASRIHEIALGSGTEEREVRSLLKQYKQSKKLMKMFKNPKNLQNMMKRFGLKQ